MNDDTKNYIDDQMTKSHLATKNEMYHLVHDTNKKMGSVQIEIKEIKNLAEQNLSHAKETNGRVKKAEDNNEKRKGEIVDLQKEDIRLENTVTNLKTSFEDRAKGIEDKLDIILKSRKKWTDYVFHTVLWVIGILAIGLLTKTGIINL